MPRFFDDPDAFMPERWLDGLEDRCLPERIFHLATGRGVASARILR